MNSSGHSTERKLVCIICIGVDDGPPVMAAGSWCKKWTPKRRRALTLSDAQIDMMPRAQREAFKSIKRDIRRCPK